MNKKLQALIVDPVNRKELQVEARETDTEGIVTGTCLADDGAIYPIRAGIPRLLITDDVNQIQTRDTFAFKWKKRDTYDSPRFKSFSTEWALEKYGFASLQDWATYYNERSRILDLGCGSGYTSSLWLDTPYWTGAAMWVGLDISEGIDVARERVGHLSNTHFVQADALSLPFRDESFDTVFSEGVLHHTPSTRQAIISGARVLEKGGEFHFYVYRKKGPVREFTDDYIRQAIAPMDDKEAWRSMRSLTKLGQALCELKAEVKIEEDIPLLGIPAGTCDVQRLVYWHFAKLFWNPSCSFEENVHVNFDWYRPAYAHRQTEEEVRQWCGEAGLNIIWFHEQESGFTVRAVKD